MAILIIPKFKDNLQLKRHPKLEILNQIDYGSRILFVISSVLDFSKISEIENQF